MEADDSLSLNYKDDESKGIKWITFEQAINDNDIVDSVKPIHKKLVKKLNQYF